MLATRWHKRLNISECFAGIPVIHHIVFYSVWGEQSAKMSSHAIYKDTVKAELFFFHLAAGEQHLCQL